MSRPVTKPTPLPVAQPDQMTTEIVSVTPQMAEKWLGRNQRNRHVRQRDVIRYAQAMSKGEWLVTGEAVKFGFDGSLLDGQHRLLAIVEAGRTIKMLVIKGLHPEAQDVLDTGRARTASDALAIHGHDNSHLVAAAAKVVILYEADLFYVDSKRQQVSHRQIVDFADANHLLAYASGLGRKIARATDMQPSIAAACIYILTLLSAEAAAEFFDKLASGANLPTGSPVLALRDRLFELRRNRTDLPMEAKVALVFRAWNAWRMNKKLALLPLYKEGRLIACPAPRG